MRVLVLCSGNICRSPMAAAYLTHAAAREGLDLEVESAGLLGIEGEPASPEAIQVLREQGVDPSPHRSRGLGRHALTKADLVVVMTRAHREELERRFPGAARRIELLRAFERGPAAVASAADLEDPIGSPIQTYRNCFWTIRTCADQLLRHLRETE